MWLCAAGAALSVLLPSSGQAETQLYQRLKASLGYHFSSGKYGTTNRTDIGYIPLVARADVGRLSFELTIPYIRISGPATFVNGPVGPVQTGGGNEDGLGDITSRGSYTFLSRTDWMPFVELIGRVKYPTADRDRGLGTGRFDAGFETELVWVVRRWVPFLGGGYRFLGSSPDIPLDNVWSGWTGAMYHLMDPLWVGLQLDYRQAANASSDERLDLVPFVSWRLGEHWSIDPYLSAGLADGSPAIGVGLQLGYTF